MMIFQTNKCEETQQLGYDFAHTLQGGEVLALKGDLGCGKTTFVQGLARGLNIKENIQSPTFVIMKIYPLAKKQKNIQQLVHLDCYRLGSVRDAKTIGLEDYLSKPDTLTVIEWPERVKQMLPQNTIWIKFYHKLPQVREIKINLLPS